MTPRSLLAPHSRTTKYVTLLFGAAIALLSSFTLRSQITGCMDSSQGMGETYELATKQSFGFFTGIPDSQWRLAQKIHAMGFPNFIPDQQSIGPEPELWYGANFQPEFHCTGTRRVPSYALADGAKWVCDPHRIASQETCLVYSFGSFGNTHFEWGVKEEISQHCEIHTFDIETNNGVNGDFEQQVRKVGATFHNWGIANQEKADRYALTKKGPPVYTLVQIMAMLNHTGRTVDIFKIDCEGCEWEVYPQLTSGLMLRQILVETHFAPDPSAMNFFKTMHDSGYVIFSKECNYFCRGACVEFSFVKVHDEFFINDSKYNLST